MKEPKAEALRWLRQAESDLEYARLGLERGFYAQVCFQCRTRAISQDLNRRSEPEKLISATRLAFCGHTVFTDRIASKIETFFGTGRGDDIGAYQRDVHTSIEFLRTIGEL